MGQKKREWKRVKKRIGATIQLYEGDDNDLIGWLYGLPEKGRNQAIKTVLRLGLRLPIPQPPAPLEPLPAAVIDDLYGIVDGLVERVDHMQVAPAQSQAIEQLKGDVGAIIRSLNELHARVDALNGVTYVEPIESVPRASDEDLQLRRQNRKKNQW